MNYKKITLIILSIILSVNLFSQTLKGIVKDGDTGEPVTNIRLEYNDDKNYAIFAVTNKKGEFTFEEISISYSDYTILNLEKNSPDWEDNYDMYLEISPDDSTFFNLIVYKESSGYWDTVKYITDIAQQNFFDAGYSFNFYSPKIDETDKYFKSNLSVDFFFEFQFKIIKNFQIGTKITPFKMAWDNIKTDTIITTLDHEKERYFSISSEYFIFLRYVSTAFDMRGLFVDFGAGYSLPYVYNYQYYTSKYVKTSVRNIHNFNNFQAMFRIGFLAFDIKATYRLTDFLKDEYIQTPRLNIGIEFNIPTFE